MERFCACKAVIIRIKLCVLYCVVLDFFGEKKARARAHTPFFSKTLVFHVCARHRQGTRSAITNARSTPTGARAAQTSTRTPQPTRQASARFARPGVSVAPPQAQGAGDVLPDMSRTQYTLIQGLGGSHLVQSRKADQQPSLPQIT
eukprot:SAG11_NODE_658_length_7897_cov_13.075789_6_plen_146_part_00